MKHIKQRAIECSAMIKTEKFHRLMILNKKPGGERVKERLWAELIRSRMIIVNYRINQRLKLRNNTPRYMCMCMHSA